jgi:site-specific DNA-methyltransferase (adenine-specific)
VAEKARGNGSISQYLLRLPGMCGAARKRSGEQMKPYYEHGGITIYHGDAEEVLSDMSEHCCDVVITSPPYNLGNTEGYLGNGRNWKNSKWTGELLREGYGAFDDNMPWPEYEEWQRRVLVACCNATAVDGAVFYNHKPRTIGTKLWTPLCLDPDIPQMELRQVITWARAGGVNFSTTHYLPTYEWILLFSRPLFRLRDQSASGVGDIWRIAQEANTEHPCPFPLELPKRAIETTNAGVILDPFCGSGTTLEAAKNLGRQGIGIDINEKYCEIAARRLSQEVFQF